MLRECQDHGYFRGEACPTCASEGKFLMNESELDQVGRIMAGVLRHFPERFGLEMDRHGFVELQSLVQAIRDRRKNLHWLRSHHIRAIADTDPKGRYAIEEGVIRATYGHSLELDLDLPTDQVPDTLFYPAPPTEVEQILEAGLKPSDRKMVHLSRSWDDARLAGAYRGIDFQLLEIHSDNAVEEGVQILRAGTTVFLTDFIPPEFIVLCKDQPSEEEKRPPKDAEEEPTADRESDAASEGSDTEADEPQSEPSE